RDNRNLDPATYNIVGGHQSFYWDQLEPTEGNYQWHYIDGFLAAQAAKGKRAAFGIITFNGRANEGNAQDPPIRVPDFVFAAGAKKVNCGGFEIPRYWDRIYRQKYENFIAALAARYDGDPRIEFIQIGVGKFGETQPCDDIDNNCVKAALEEDGLTEWSWPSIVNDIVDIYTRHFQHTRLLLPNAPRFMNECDRREFTDYAISSGVGLFPAGLYAIQEWVDLRTKPGWDGCGKYDRILDQAEEADNINPWVPVAFEMYHYMTPDSTTFYWAVLAGLSRRADYITAERSVLYVGEPDDPEVTPIAENIAIMGWAAQYMGKHIEETPSVWVALREAGYADNFYPQKGNYSWWLYQDDSIPNGRTVPTTYRSKPELVHPSDYAYYGDSCVRSTIETSQYFLGPSREGWICRRTDQASGNRYMWFRINDHYIYGGPVEATITVTYFDRGTDTWQLQYDALGNAYKVAGTIVKTNTNTWKQAVFHVTDAWFGNMELGGADFRIDCMGDGNEYIHMVDVRKEGQGVTPTPTNTLNPSITPTETATPSATPTASITPTPSNTPAVTPTPVVVQLPCGKDTMISGWYPSENFGLDHRVKVRKIAYRSLLYFDTSSIPTNAVVSRATLHLYLDWYEHMMNLSPNVSIFKVLQDWEEMEANWTHRTTSLSWGAAGCDSSSDRSMTASGVATITEVNSWYQWDITSLVQDWVSHPWENKGMILISDSGRELRFYSSNYSSQRPYLQIEYIVSGEPVPTITPTLSPTPGSTPSVEPTPGIVEIRNASQDAYIDFGDPTGTHENLGLRVYGFGYKRSLLDFDISAIPPGAEIVSATLRLTASTYDDGRTERPLNVGVYRVNRPWLASQVTWQSAADSVPWGSSGCDSIPADREASPASVTRVQEISTGTHPWQRVTYEWDVTSIVQAWVNNPSAKAGLILISQDEMYRDIGFYDSAFMGEAGRDLHPVLFVQWRLPQATATPTPTLTPTLSPSAGTISGMVFDDENANSIHEGGELGLSGVVVQLKSGAVVVQTQSTDSAGNYTFVGVPAGTYMVQVVVPAGYVATTQNPRGVVLSAGQVLTNV
ncbi:MAG: DNRLRE domain-containing protein, partial [Anaerolineae bacterium]|nr:DNRLRE domain-containing protein [Anaerolineae bacterium]